MKTKVMVAFLAIGLLALTAPTFAAEEIVKHSGKIVAISDGAGTFVLGEVGPWQVRDGETVVTRRTIMLTPATQFVMVGRADDAPSGFPGDFVDVALGADAIYLYDFVTVECRHDGKRLLALKITVVDQTDVTRYDDAHPRGN
jgi:hypothetical protein